MRPPPTDEIAREQLAELILMRCEIDPNGEILDSDCCEKLRSLPLDRMQLLDDELREERAHLTGRRPHAILLKIYHEWRAKEQTH
ncbi:hypothetical protein [Limnoglobus roseus]|uniref:Uncharacterized protein n=1 Tax=Limnoglobus roseus TaxID=2598579 RepID=A0A5C1AKU8_9BACT|nr:hypothetical protein [Limnoglobus roseus]QEL19841.1 hypothetical protein PX52LOC_06922 [Limnoglobus roseus]